MKYDPQVHHRRSIRLKDYDYASAGAYFITIVVQRRLCLLGDIADDTMRLNDAGHMIERWWLELNQKFPYVETDEYVVMPNHLHGIIVIVGGDRTSGAHAGAPLPSPSVEANRRVAPDAGAEGVHASDAHAGEPLPGIVQWFKTMTTNEYIRGVNRSTWTAFPGRFWQRNYYEHVIRDSESLDRMRAYIQDNPLQWALDDENPDRSGTASARTL